MCASHVRSHIFSARWTGGKISWNQPLIKMSTKSTMVIRIDNSIIRYFNFPRNVITVFLLSDQFLDLSRLMEKCLSVALVYRNWLWLSCSFDSFFKNSLCMHFNCYIYSIIKISSMVKYTKHVETEPINWKNIFKFRRKYQTMF